MKKSVFILMIIVVGLAKVLAGEAENLFAEGNKAYKAKEYEKAIAAYEQLATQGYRSADLQYNLGNAWYRRGSVGRAVLHYERVLVLQPKHEPALKNLAFLRSKINAEIAPLPDFFLTKWWKTSRMSLGSTAMGILAMAFWWAGFGALVYWLLAKTKSQKKWGLVAGCCLLVISLLPFALALSRTAFEKNTGQAILVQKSAILRSAPEDGSQEVQTLAEGTKLQQITQLDGWWQVNLENGETGWLPEQALERI